MYALPEEPGGPGSRPGAGLGLDAETGWAASPEPGSPGPVAPPRSARSTSVNVPGAPAGEASGEAGGGAPAAGHSGSQPDASDYRARSSRLARYLVELLTSAEASANLVVLRTPAGAAQFLASVIDHAVWPSILGTVAGDDTVLVITRDPAGGDALAAEFLRLAERRRLFLGGGPEGHPPDPPARCGSRRIITRPGGPRPSAGTRSRNVSRGRGSLRVHPP
ncbi:MAG: hypothetical protein JOY82_17505 [Streptosporangiaceae bacterium]|nr:hypothetical protein [Streptosporangiaceae bacterium]MBV9856289.1 hypothetical protein [Streptosporangiaceae bacterium]